MARRLVHRRGKRSRYSVSKTVSRHVLRRLEAAENEAVDLNTLWLLCHHYDCSLRRLLHPGNDTAVGRFEGRGSSLPAVLHHFRHQLRARRKGAGWGAIRLRNELERVFALHPSWLYRLESGEMASIDMVRVAALCHVMNTTPDTLLPEDFRAP